MLGYSDYTQFFIAMLAIVDPIAILPFYSHVIRNADTATRRRLAQRTALAATITLVAAVFIGQSVLNFFGISIGSFQVAGGLLLIILAMQLLQHRPDQQLDFSNANSESQVVVPLAIPLLAGPGALSTVIVFTHESHHWQHAGILSLCLLLIGLITWLTLHLSSRILDRLSPLTMSIINKLMGLILAAISVEFIAKGIKQLFSMSA